PPPPPSPPPQPMTRVQPRYLIVAAAVLIFAAGLVIGRLTVGSGAKTPLDAVGLEIWGDWLHDPEGVVICFSNPLTGVLKHFPVPQPDGSLPKRVRLTPEQEEFTRSVLKLPTGGYIYFSPAISQAKMGEAIGAVDLGSLLTACGARVRTTQSRFVTWE